MTRSSATPPDPVTAWTLRKRRVLVPFDFSEASRKALKVAGTFVPDAGGPEGGAVSVIHVIIPPPMTAPGRLLRGPFDEERAIAKGFSALREALHDAELPGFEPCVRVAPNPAEEIVAFAERESTELIVISSHARRGLDRGGKGGIHPSDGLRQIFERRVFEQAAEGQIASELLANLGEDTGGEQRMAAEFEEVIARGNDRQVEDVAPDRRQGDFDFALERMRSTALLDSLRIGQSTAIQFAVRS